MGAGNSAPFFLSAICFSVAMQAGINPLLASLAVWTGSMVGGSVPWTSGYATSFGQLEIYFEPELSQACTVGYYLWKAVFYSGLYLAMFFLLKGYKVNCTQVELEKPEPFTSRQKVSLYIIIGVIALMVIPEGIKILCPVPTIVKLCKIFSFQLLALGGIVINILKNTAAYETVIKEKIPWDTLLMLSLTGLYMALANSLGIVEFMADFLQNSISASWILPGMVIIMCILSFFVSGAVIIPMMLPLLPMLSEISGASIPAVYCAAQVGLTASSISPFSQGGASALTGCPDAKLRNQLIREQIILSGVFSVLMFVIAFLGGFSML